jgi:non-specific serine/threonine protein kinase/serine/threonine-protein kinase
MTPGLWREAEAVFLSALDLTPEERPAYVAAACAGRPELEAEVASLLAADAAAGSFLGEPGLAESAVWVGRRLGPYRLLDKIGEGGMGAVFRALREDQFRKEVAVKIVRTGLPAADLRRRFLEERQILATLEHPHIARLLDGGSTEDGLPYMVLEYVEGRPITEYCREIPLRARLELFQKVCLAVHYAHQRLVVHRDIKPGNILITAEGTPRLLDFGIAKILDPLTAGAEATRGPLQPLTPEYASPEQLSGAALTTATDIYSLGILFYELVTGNRPAGRADEPGGIPVCPELAPDLAAIAGKALRPEPQDRYASAQELADDVSRFLGNLPVHAHRGSRWYAARKMLARHRLAFALTAVSGVLIAAGVAAVAWEAHVAGIQRARAQKRFDELHQLAHSLIFELHDGIARVPGSTEVRRLLVSRALKYLDSLAADAGGDVRLQVELAAAYRRVGDAQGRWNYSNLGDPAGALASYRKGLQAADAALRAEPRRDDALVEAGWLHLRAGEICIEERDTGQARRHMEQALAIFRSRSPGPGARTDLASALLSTAIATRLANPDDALGDLDQARALYEEELAAHPRDAVGMSNLAMVHRYRALYGDRASALRNLRRALELDEQRVTVNASDAHSRLDLAIDLSELGQRYVNVGPESDPASALGYFRRSLAIREEFAQADPKDVMARTRVAFAHLSIARASLEGGKPGDAAGSARRCIEILEPLLAANPANKGDRGWMAEGYLILARAEWHLGQPEPACAAFGRGARIAAELPTAGADQWLAGIQRALADGVSGCGR